MLSEVISLAFAGGETGRALVVAMIPSAATLIGLYIRSLLGRRSARQEHELRVSQFWRDDVAMMRTELVSTREDLRKALEEIEGLRAELERSNVLIGGLYGRIGLLHEENRLLRFQLKMDANTTLLDPGVLA